jgi:hypothetical protein
LRAARSSSPQCRNPLADISVLKFPAIAPQCEMSASDGMVARYQRPVRTAPAQA